MSYLSFARQTIYCVMQCSCVSLNVRHGSFHINVAELEVRHQNVISDALASLYQFMSLLRHLILAIAAWNLVLSSTKRSHLSIHQSHHTRVRDTVFARRLIDFCFPSNGFLRSWDCSFCSLCYRNLLQLASYYPRQPGRRTLPVLGLWQ